MSTGYYHDPATCNKCGSSTDMTIKDTIANFPCEYETKCKVCGFEDYWAYGYFESGAEGYDKCGRYGMDAFKTETSKSTKEIANTIDAEILEEMRKMI